MNLVNGYSKFVLDPLDLQKTGIMGILMSSATENEKGLMRTVRS